MPPHLRPSIPTRARRGARQLTHSAVSGPTHPPLDSRTFAAYFDQEILAKHGARPALLCPREPPRPHGGPIGRNLSLQMQGSAREHLAWDFQEFDRQIGALARGLVGLGVRKGDRVATLMGNNSAYAMLQWACARIGAILVTVNPAYRVHELVNTLSLVGVSQLFIVPSIRSSRYLDLLSKELPSLSSQQPGSIQEERLPALRGIAVVDNTLGKEGVRPFKEDLEVIKCAVDFREVLVWREKGREERIVREMERSLQNDDVMNLQFTSGTTGMPKAVSLTHSNLLNNAISIGDAMNLTPEDVVCNVPPLFHCFGLVLGNLAAWVRGAAIVYPSEIFDPRAIVDAVLGLRCTALHGVPTHFLGVLAEVERRRAEGERLDFSALRTGIAAGSPVPIQLMKQLIEDINLRELTNAYGMTETSPVSFQTVPTDPLLKRVETVGRVRPHVKAKVVDEEGNIVPIGTPGELLVSGYLVQKGYWEDEEQTKKVIKRNPEHEETVWMHTGDQAVMDAEGYLSIVSRIKDIIIRGGENLFPIQIENTLTSDPEILEAAVVAVPNARYGEVVGAWVVPRPEARATLTRERVRRIVWNGMNPQNAPQWVWFVGEGGEEMGLQALPKTPSGKVQKHVLRELSRELAEKRIGLVES
ncbi:acetyl-CoA synthetase-like protein [Dentipellis sp. KUC8613]|nr:acetyl-CoA synthetase-like protein [Dentipellis sp. KUC8613]